MSFNWDQVTILVQKTNIVLVIVGGLIATGIILSFYGNQVVFEGLVQKEGVVTNQKRMEVEMELDPNQSQSGIYAVQFIDFKDDVLEAMILDPFGTQVSSVEINKDVIENKFDITTEGKYRLIIESKIPEESRVIGVIGPEPDANQKSLAFLSMYLLIVGLIGMAGLGIYAIKNRIRRAS